MDKHILFQDKLGNWQLGGHKKTTKIQYRHWSCHHFFTVDIEKTCPDKFIHLFQKTKAEIHNCSYNKPRKQSSWQILQVSQMKVQKAITTRTIWGAEYHRHIAHLVTVFPYYWGEASNEAEEWREAQEHKKDQRCEMIKGVKDQRCETEIGKMSQKKRGKNSHTSSTDWAAVFH